MHVLHVMYLQLYSCNQLVLVYIQLEINTYTQIVLICVNKNKPYIFVIYTTTAQDFRLCLCALASVNLVS
jgi:hypothetical protein